MCTYEINNIHFQSSYKKQWILFDNLHWKLSDHLVLRGNIFENLGRFLQNICKKFVKLNQIVAVIQFRLLSAVLYLIFNFVQDYQSVVWPSHLKTGHWKIWDHMFIKKIIQSWTTIRSLKWQIWPSDVINRRNAVAVVCNYQIMISIGENVKAWPVAVTYKLRLSLIGMWYVWMALCGRTESLLECNYKLLYEKGVVFIVS